MRPKESGEMYLEIILELEKRNGRVRSIDIANELDYSKPSISRAMNILKKSGFIEMPPYGDITLTEKGRQKAIDIFTRHKQLTGFLMLSLGLTYEIAEADACRIEHIVSLETMDAIAKYIDKNE